VSPPVLGFNNNVRHRGRVFHIQTEDSGVKSPRIVTHLFADGGRIIKTARTSYPELIGRADLSQVVRQLMKDQHKAMFIALRGGELDELLESSCGPLPLPPVVAGSAVATPNRSLTNPNIHKIPPSVAPASREEIDLAVGTLNQLEHEPALPHAKSEPPRKSSPAPARIARATASSNSSARPASRYGSLPSKSARSIFGDGVISEKSLDEVILSYLAEDLEPSE
jgi:hypothetical protein